MAYGSSTFSALASLLVAHFFRQDSVGGILKTVNIFNLGNVIISVCIQHIQWKWTYVEDRDKLSVLGSCSMVAFKAVAITLFMLL